MMYLYNSMRSNLKRWFGDNNKIKEEIKVQKPKDLMLQEPTFRRLQLISLNDFLKEFIQGNHPEISNGVYKKWLNEMIDFATLVMIGQAENAKKSIADDCATMLARQLITGVINVPSYLYQKNVSFPSIKCLIRYLTNGQPLSSDDVLFSRLRDSIFELMLKQRNNQERINIVLKHLALDNIDIRSPSYPAYIKSGLMEKLMSTIPQSIYETYFRIFDTCSSVANFDIEKAAMAFSECGSNLYKMIKVERENYLQKFIQEGEARQIELQKIIEEKESTDLKAKRDERLRQLSSLKHQRYLNFCMSTIPLTISCYFDSDPANLIYPFFVNIHQSYRLLEMHTHVYQQANLLEKMIYESISKMQESVTEKEKKLIGMKIQRDDEIRQLDTLRHRSYWLISENALFFILYSLNHLSPYGLISFLLLNSYQSYDLLKTQETIYQQVVTSLERIFKTTRQKENQPLQMSATDTPATKSSLIAASSPLFHPT